MKRLSNIILKIWESSNIKWLSISAICLIVLFACLHCESDDDSKDSDTTNGISSSDVEFTVAGITYSGYLSQPKQAGIYPVVLVLHGSEGYQEHHKDYAEEIAEADYIVLAYCWYGCNSRATMADVENADFTNVFKYIKELPNANPSKSGIVGFSAGAAMTIYQGTLLNELSAIVEYYGISKIPSEAINLVTANNGSINVNLSKLAVPILIIQGTADQVNTFSDVKSMVEQLDNLKKHKILYTTPEQPIPSIGQIRTV